MAICLSLLSPNPRLAVVLLQLLQILYGSFGLHRIFYIRDHGPIIEIFFLIIVIILFLILFL
ncbi:hypothetical protein C1645_788125, partial [Glomus cerebriforme]